MSPMQQTNERVVRAGYDAFNRRDWEAAMEPVAGAFEMVNVPTGECFAGREGLRRYLRGWVAAFPDLRVEVTALYAEECRVAVETVARGTHTGPLATPGGEVAATGRAVTVHGLELWDLREGRTVRARTYYDTAALMRQLGLEPELDGPATPLVLNLMGVRLSAPEQAHHELARRYLAALAAGDERVLEDLRAPGFRADGAWDRAASSDATLRVEDSVAEGDRVAVRWTAEGVDGDGRAARWSGTTFLRVEAGRVAGEWTTLADTVETSERVGG